MIAHRLERALPLPVDSNAQGYREDFMKDITLWVGWYGMLVTLPLFVAGLWVKARMASAVPQWVRSHRR
ncbi:MAG: hypothetical protein LZF60_270042 [Nitrospira sp.]|nr:MAG: hypothetical protein LZF60_270042 [Nitrospira sp.]